jgi:hypothetical protein
MTQALLKAKQHRFFVAPLGIEDAVGVKPRAGQRRGKKIARPQAPKHRTFETGEDARGKERGGRAMHGARPAARDLMQGPEDEPALRQAGIDFLKAEGECGLRRMGAGLEAGDPRTQIVQKKFLPLLQHGFSGALGHSFLLCSLFSGRVNARRRPKICAGKGFVYARVTKAALAIVSGDASHACSKFRCEDNMGVVYTIGYEGTDIDRLLATLKAVGVKRLAGVRAVALSRKKGFSKKPLAARLASEGIEYFHFIGLVARVI